jgi:hypothetical protein
MNHAIQQILGHHVPTKSPDMRMLCSVSGVPWRRLIEIATSGGTLVTGLEIRERRDVEATAAAGESR